jgi:hypothetical protein
MSCSVNLATRLYGVYSTEPSTWTMSDELAFALFSDIIARNQKNVHNQIETKMYNNTIYYDSHNTINYNVNMTLTYNAAGEVEPGDGNNTGNPGQGNNGQGDNPPGGGVGRNINIKV